MRILICNDDGIHAAGLDALAEVARAFGDVWIVAPHVEASASSHAITLHEPLRLLPRGHQRFAVTGTPTDCAYVGLHHLFEEPFDLVLSGVNHGPNLGIDVLYSGTVAAAMEGARYGVPSIAFSLVGRSFPDACWVDVRRVVHEVLTWFMQGPTLPTERVLNVNIPMGPLPTPAPLRATRLGHVHYPPHVEEKQDPRGRSYLWIGGRPPVLSNEPGTDCAAVQEGCVSITPLLLDLTDHSLQITI